ncbi:alanyl-tRNA editing protein [Roseococcus thiosulfatophilus]|uniref:alanyl-tRNA editing protein n=1 Tax=Roseococcus thiosulfatophilus TaxID=35813 RepID=UPI001A8C79CC|nr:alanyl-tRNA editing protein [Roseococcus thiosulfatophilus]
MTEALFRHNAYAQEAAAHVVSAGPEGLVLDRSIFYPRAGGQPGDSGKLCWDGGDAAITEAVKGEGDAILHKLADGAPLPAPGTQVTLVLDWARRHRHMRMHSAMHLLCSLIPGAGVTGGQVGAEKSRLDFDLAEPPAKEWLTERLNALVTEGHPITEEWITEAELEANPGLVRTLSVQPPRGAGRIRLVRIGSQTAPVDLQPCGGTHVRSTAEIGRLEVLKLENKGRQNRRISLALVEN